MIPTLKSIGDFPSGPMLSLLIDEEKSVTTAQESDSTFIAFGLLDCVVPGQITKQHPMVEVPTPVVPFAIGWITTRGQNWMNHGDGSWETVLELPKLLW